MATCVFVDVDGLVKASVADPCTSAVLLTPTEYGLWVASPLNLAPADAVVLSSAVIACWASAFAIRALVRTLNVADGDSGDGHF